MSVVNNAGKLKNNTAQSGNTLYLIVVKPVWDRIVSGDKRIEYRERTDYWDKRIGDREYQYIRITNGYERQYPMLCN
jgi:hypothetical protein